MRHTGKRIAILAENMYQEMELWVPYYRLKEEGAKGPAGFLPGSDQGLGEGKLTWKHASAQINMAREEVFDSIVLTCYDPLCIRDPHQLRVNGAMSREGCR